MIIKLEQNHIESVINLVKASGLFDIEGINHINQSLAEYFAGNDALWFLAFDDETLVGVVYCTPEPMTEGTWNILMLLIAPSYQRQGHGQSLISHVEKTLEALGERLIIVETSSLDEFKQARSFYLKCGYVEEARIRNFYAANDDKIVFSKSLMV